MLSSNKKILTRENMNPRVRKAEYAVRGELAIRSEQIKTVCDIPTDSLSVSIAFPSLFSPFQGKAGGIWLGKHGQKGEFLSLHNSSHRSSLRIQIRSLPMLTLLTPSLCLCPFSFIFRNLPKVHLSHSRRSLPVISETLSPWTRNPLHSSVR